MTAHLLFPDWAKGEYAQLVAILGVAILLAAIARELWGRAK